MRLTKLTSKQKVKLAHFVSYKPVHEFSPDTDDAHALMVAEKIEQLHDEGNTEILNIMRGAVCVGALKFLSAQSNDTTAPSGNGNSFTAP
jgi:hypothetical protein